MNTAKPLCRHCLLASKFCICHLAPQLSDGIADDNAFPLNDDNSYRAVKPSKLPQIILITHPTETRKATNTGKLILKAMPTAQCWEWQSLHTPERLEQFLKDVQRRVYLLYPEASSKNESVPQQGNHQTLSQRVASNQPKGVYQESVYIVLDATWQQAQKMLRQCPPLQALERWSLPSSQSRFHLRRNQQPGNVSTVEAIIALLQQLSFTSQSQQLDDYFQLFLTHYEAHRSGHRA